MRRYTYREASLAMTLRFALVLLSNGHLLGHIALAARPTAAETGRGASLLLEELPELEALVGR